MKVCYIIMPFKNSEYLIRCVNSLYRQQGGEFEVILAENDFCDESKRIEEFLLNQVQIKRISKSAEKDTDKLLEAKSLISDASGYVQLLNVDTVVSPIMAKAILECRKSDLIVPMMAVQNSEDFQIDVIDELTLQKNFDEYVPQRFCYEKTLFNEIDLECIENPRMFSLFLLTLLTQRKIISFIDDVCMYSAAYAIIPVEKMAFGDVKNWWENICCRLFMLSCVEAQIFNFDKIVHMIGGFFLDKDRKMHRTAFALLQDMGMKMQEKIIFKRFFEDRIGMELEDFLSMNCEEYVVYITYLAKPFSAVFNETQIVNPADEVPKMYREGKLGMRTIMKSISGWLKYKSGRKGKMGV